MKKFTKQRLLNTGYININDKILYKQYNNRDYVWYVQVWGDEISDIKLIKLDKLLMFTEIGNHIKKGS